MKKYKIMLLNLVTALSLVGCVTTIPSESSSEESVPSTSEKPSESISNSTSSEEPSESVSTNTGCDIHMDDDANNICDICGNILIEYDYSCDGLYTLESMTVSGVEVQDTYYENYLRLNEGEVEWVKTTLVGKTVDSATYEKEDETVTIKVGIMPYTFTYDDENKTLTFNGTMNKKKTKMTYSMDENYQIKTSTGAVKFTDELFGDDINENFYNYCPTIFMEGNDTMHIWYCSNEISGNVTDYVAYRKGTLTADGKWTFTEKSLVLDPGEKGEWDSRHVCDPSVVKGKFNYNNKQYNYLMAYLGCYTSNVTCNEVGIAVAEKPEGPWVKVKEVNPIANYYTSDDYPGGEEFWGYGQPSLVSVDKEGKVLLFYTKGVKQGTFTYAEKWDLSNLNNPIKLNGAKLADGGEIGVFNNADFAYDPVNKRIYTVKEDHINGWYPTDGGVDWISASNSVFYTGMGSNDAEVGDTLFKSHNWAKVTTIGKSATGFDRVHNSGIVTDAYGWIIDHTSVPVVYTMSRLATEFPNWNKGGQWPALHTYRLHGYNVEI